MKTWHIVALIFGGGLLIYFFSKKGVKGTVTALESEATITYQKVMGSTMLPGAGDGTVDFGTERG